MMLELVLLIMTAAAVLAVLVPLARRRDGPTGGEAAVYRDQLAEIERDRANGTLGEAEAEAARTEVARRLIAASEPSAPDAAPAFVSQNGRRLAAAAALVGLPLLAAGFYASLGRPDLPDRPLAARQAEPPEAQPIADLVARVEAELAKRPDDGQGWDVIAPVYLRSGQPEKAAAAFANAIRLLGPSASREAGHGEALTLAAEGRVTPEAKAAFERSVVLDPQEPRARFYIGRAAEQAGNRAQAADIYRGLIADAPTDAPWREIAREALAAAALGPEGRAPAIDPQALENVSADQRLATIRGMVEGLAARLKEVPHDLGAQLRLVRAWTMLGEPDRAKAAAEEARTAFAGDPEALRRIADLMLGLGLEDKPA